MTIIVYGKIPCPDCGKELIVKEDGNEVHCHHLWGSIPYPKVVEKIKELRDDYKIKSLKKEIKVNKKLIKSFNKNCKK